MEDKLIRKFNLPKYIKGKTFADASKAIDRQFKGKTDKASMETKQELLSRLADAQEYIKQEQGLDQPQEQFAKGGFMEGLMPGIGMAQTGLGFLQGAMDGRKEGAMGTASNMLSGAAAGAALGPLGAAGGALIGGVSSLFGKSAEEIEMKQNKNAAQAANSNLTSDFKYGGSTGKSNKAVYGYPHGGQHDPGDTLRLDTSLTDPDPLRMQLPLGFPTQTGAHIPVQSGIRMQVNPYAKVGPNKQETEWFPLKGLSSFDTRLERPDQMWPSNIPKADPFALPSFDSIYKKPGTTGGSGTGSATAGRTPIGKVATSPAGSTLPGPTVTGSQGKLYNPGTPEVAGKTGVGNFLDKAGDFLNKNAATALRYASAVTDLIQLANLKKPKYESLDRLDNRYKKDLVDENALRNQVQQEADNTRRALQGLSTGSIGAARSGILGTQINASNALTRALMESDNINRGENAREQEFNANIGAQNLKQGNLETEINARNQGQYETNKSQLIAQLGTNLGNIGKEERFKQMVKEMGICYDARGRYICGTQERVPDDYQAEQTTAATTQIGPKALGGPTDDMFTSYLDMILSKRRK